MAQIKDVMAQFLWKARDISGSEKTFHALFYDHLFEAPFPHTQIAREHRIARVVHHLSAMGFSGTGDKVEIFAEGAMSRVLILTG